VTQERREPYVGSAKWAEDISARGWRECRPGAVRPPQPPIEPLLPIFAAARDARNRQFNAALAVRAARIRTMLGLPEGTLVNLNTPLEPDDDGSNLSP
jgi:hypothetical protein